MAVVCPAPASRECASWDLIVYRGVLYRGYEVVHYIAICMFEPCTVFRLYGESI